MSQVSANSIRDAARFGVHPSDAGLQSVGFQTKENAQGQTTLMALRLYLAVLGLPYTCKLLQAMVIDRSWPGIQAVVSRLGAAHVRASGSPVITIAVSARCLQRLQLAATFEMNAMTLPRGMRVLKRTVTLTIWTNRQVMLQAVQPVPPPLQALPTIKKNLFRLETLRLGTMNHLVEVLLRTHAVFFVIGLRVARPPRFSTFPQESKKNGTLLDTVAFVRPGSRQQLHLRSVGFAQGGIIKDKFLTFNEQQRFECWPRRLAIRSSLMQQLGVVIACRPSHFAWIRGNGFHDHGAVLYGFQIVAVAPFVTFWAFLLRLYRGCAMPHL